MEEWEITLSAGTVAQGVIQGWATTEGLTPANDGEVMSLAAGRAVAVLVRLEELEEELLNRCCSGIIARGMDAKSSGELFASLGVSEQELAAWQQDGGDADRAQRASAASDAVALFDAELRNNR